MTVSGVGHCRQVGCPESGVDAAVAELVRRGHKVGRIEQMETAARPRRGRGVRRRSSEGNWRGSSHQSRSWTATSRAARGRSPRTPRTPLAFAERGDGEEPRRRRNREPDAADGDATVGFAFCRRRRGSASRGFLRRRRLPRESRDAPVAHGAGGGCDAPRRPSARRAALAKTPSAPRVVALAPRTEFPEDGAARGRRADARRPWDGGASRDERADETNTQIRGRVGRGA